MFQCRPWVIQAVDHAVTVVCGCHLSTPSSEATDDDWSRAGGLGEVYRNVDYLRELVDRGAVFTREQRKQLRAKAKEAAQADEPHLESSIMGLIASSKVPSEERAAAHAAFEQLTQGWLEAERRAEEREKALALARDYSALDGEPKRIRAPGYERRLDRDRTKRTLEANRQLSRRHRQRLRDCITPA